jgi:hypothetical protein
MFRPLGNLQVDSKNCRRKISYTALLCNTAPKKGGGEISFYNNFWGVSVWIKYGKSCWLQLYDQLVHQHGVFRIGFTVGMRTRRLVHSCSLASRGCGCGVHDIGYVLWDIWCLGVDENVWADYLRLTILLCDVCIRHTRGSYLYQYYITHNGDVTTQVWGFPYMEHRIESIVWEFQPIMLVTYLSPKFQ